MNTETNEQDLDFEQMMQQRMQDNFSGFEGESPDLSDERLAEMSKKLPDWSLEPPYSFIK